MITEPSERLTADCGLLSREQSRLASSWSALAGGQIVEGQFHAVTAQDLLMLARPRRDLEDRYALGHAAELP